MHSNFANYCIYIVQICIIKNTQERKITFYEKLSSCSDKVILMDLNCQIPTGKLSVKSFSVFNLERMLQLSDQELYKD